MQKCSNILYYSYSFFLSVFLSFCSFISSLSSSKADIRNPLSLLAHERSRFATCQWELLTPTDISIPLTHRLVLYALEAGECLFCVQSFIAHLIFNIILICLFSYIILPYANRSTRFSSQNQKKNWKFSQKRVYC